MKELVIYNESNVPVTNSLLVAQKFEKRHDHVLAVIRKLTTENSGVLLMFEESTYLNENNKPQPLFIMNRDGFTLLVMGFTGKKAFQFKLDFIDAFNKMEAAIKEHKALTTAEMFLQNAQLMVENEKRLSKIEIKTNDLENTVNSIVEKQQKAEAELKMLPVSTEKVPELLTRDKVRKCVNYYANAKGIDQHNVWANIYDRLYYNWHINLRNYKKGKGESLLDIADKNGHIDKLYAIASDLAQSV